MLFIHVYTTTSPGFFGVTRLQLTIVLQKRVRQKTNTATAFPFPWIRGQHTDLRDPVSTFASEDSVEPSTNVCFFSNTRSQVVVNSPLN